MASYSASMRFLGVKLKNGLKIGLKAMLLVAKMYV